jgi:hypothetical protein
LSAAAQVNAIADLLGETPANEPNDAPSQDGDAEAQPEADAPVDFDPEAFYAQEITTGDGEKVTIGALKDAYQSRQQAERETAKRSVALDERESALAQDQRFWMELGELPVPVKAKIAERMQARERAEHGKMLAMMPELKDKAHFDTFRTEIVEALGKYGYTPAQIVVTDHRQLMILRDLIRAQARIKALTAEPAAKAPPAKPGGRSGSPQPGRPRNQAEAVTQIAQLLR